MGALSPTAHEAESRMHNHDMSLGVITYRNNSNVEGHLKERTKRRNEIMKRQMS
jgi:hypothetical protein